MFTPFSYTTLTLWSKTHVERERLYKLNSLNYQYSNTGVTVNSFNSVSEKRTIFHLWCKVDPQQSLHFCVTIEIEDQTEKHYKCWICLLAGFNAVCTELYW